MTERPRLGLTTARQAVVAVLAGAVVCWLMLLGFDLSGGFPPVVPWSLPITLALLAIAVAIYSRVLPRRREHHKAGPHESFAALGIGKAIVMTGAALAGGHVVYVMRYLQLFDAPLPSQRVIQGAVTIIVSILLAGAGYLLERACIVRDDDDEDHQPGSTASA